MTTGNGAVLEVRALARKENPVVYVLASDWERAKAMDRVIPVVEVHRRDDDRTVVHYLQNSHFEALRGEKFDFITPALEMLNDYIAN